MTKTHFLTDLEVLSVSFCVHHACHSQIILLSISNIAIGKKKAIRKRRIAKRVWLGVVVDYFYSNPYAKT